MLTRRLRDESGYSLVEVMASVVILAIAIIPMVAMFDMGLTTATRAGNYDKARALAKKQLEAAQSLPYATVKTNFPNAPCTFDGSGLCESTGNQDPSTEFSNFRYTIRKQYVQPNGSDTAFVNADEDKGMMRVSVIVGWGGPGFDDNQITVNALKAR
jgi:prepilin-type N-terminal cleavage/methylation domain-containing protein